MSSSKSPRSAWPTGSPTSASWRWTGGSRPSWSRTARVRAPDDGARDGDDWLVVTLWSTEADAAAFEARHRGARGAAGFARAVEAGSTLHVARYDTLD